eukprot:scaffold869_cov105-Isochrysis_galbana.AAC.40
MVVAFTPGTLAPLLLPALLLPLPALLLARAGHSFLLPPFLLLRRPLNPGRPAAGCIHRTARPLAVDPSTTKDGLRIGGR